MVTTNEQKRYHKVREVAIATKEIIDKAVSDIQAIIEHNIRTTAGEGMATIIIRKQFINAAVDFESTPEKTKDE